ncbi:hypothetical protein FS842_005964 [Serendipita sp. 407]|nr:hypothetical protein FRC16_007277 [Serendipita sp. 398]KAG8837715.1 hypothetical protein FRC20_006618 [Serendipita sp. 405]KAG9058627.1 hypothetical protein FS842_005964 [Serendipita sp. 407]
MDVMDVMRRGVHAKESDHNGDGDERGLTNGHLDSHLGSSDCLVSRSNFRVETGEEGVKKSIARRAVAATLQQAVVYIELAEFIAWNVSLAPVFMSRNTGESLVESIQRFAVYHERND